MATRLTKAQMRARHAYSSVGGVEQSLRDDYKILVDSFGPNIVRSGLAAAISMLERERKREKRGPTIDTLFAHIVDGGIAGLPRTVSPSDLPDRIRALDRGDYMLATRDILALVVWLKRAVQATFSRSDSDTGDR